MNRRVDWFVVITSIVFAVSCSGSGCSGCGMTPIPGGFPSAKRNPNAAQLRVSSSGLTAVSANPAALLSSLTGSMGGLSFNVPASCGGSTPICCPGGTAQNPCGPINIDLTLHPGDSPRLVLAPKANASELDVTVRARITTGMDIPVTVPVIGDCGVHVDTTPGPTQDVQIDVPITFVQDATAGTTNVVVGTVALTNLTTDDVSLTGGIACDIANLGLSFFLSTLTSTLTTEIQSTIQNQTCKKCPSGTVDECGPFATACTNNVCEEGSACLQELGIDGRATGGSILANISPTTTGALDLYEVTGGYATSNNNGLALGLLGGMEPGGAPRDQCGPVSTEPAKVAVPQSAFFQGNTRPDTGAPFDIAIGLHASQLTQFAYAGYNGGLLCLTLGHDTISQLSTDTIGLLSRSLTHLVDLPAPVAIGLRPQSPPTITLGPNTFMDNGSGMQVVDQPLLDIKFTGMEIDFFAAVSDQFIRIFTVVADVHLPLGLQVAAMGKLEPVLANISDAFTNISVKNSDAVTESPADLASLFPTILNLVLPQLSSALPTFTLPSLGGINLDVTDITSVDNNTFLAIFANLTPATPAVAVHTHADLIGQSEPAEAVFGKPSLWAANVQPSAHLALGGDASDLEWSLRVDHGTWSAWTKNATPTVSMPQFWLAGDHQIEVVARRIGHPETIDRQPVVLPVTFGTPPASIKVAGGVTPTGGCGCDSGGGAGDAAPFALLIVMMIVPWRRRLGALAVRVRRLGAVVWIAALASLPGCSCSSHPCGSTDCMAGDVPHGALGEFTSIASDDQRVMVATYDKQLGDLVAVDVTDPANQKLVAVDGIPDDPPTYDPSTYRGGISDPGPDVGANTSITMFNHVALIAYEDRDNHALKFAAEQTPGTWQSEVVDMGMGEDVGRYTSIVVDGSGHPAIAYLAVGKDDGAGQRITELRLARAANANPGTGDWSTAVIASAPGTCAGLCAAGETCVAPATATDFEACVAPTSDCTTACSATQACVSGTCRAAIADPTVSDIPTGTGLFGKLLAMPDGRLAIAYYDRTNKALILSVESAASSNTFAPTTLDTATPGDRGQWASAAVDAAGTVHVAYQDAVTNELMYTTWNATPGTPEVADDGTRPPDRTHRVGASAAMYFVNNTPTVAYQDGMLSDVVIGTRTAANNWSLSPFATGPLLDGFSIGATVFNGKAYFAWDQLNPANDPPNSLEVQTQ